MHIVSDTQVFYFQDVCDFIESSKTLAYRSWGDPSNALLLKKRDHSLEPSVDCALCMKKEENISPDIVQLS